MKKNFIFLSICLFVGLTFACATTSSKEGIKKGNFNPLVLGMLKARVIDDNQNIDQYYDLGINISVIDLDMLEEDPNNKNLISSETKENGSFNFNSLIDSHRYRISEITIPGCGILPKITIDLNFENLDCDSFVPVGGKFLSLGNLACTVDLNNGKCTFERLGELESDSFIYQNLYENPQSIELSVSELEAIRNQMKIKFVEIPGQNLLMSETEVTVELYNDLFNLTYNEDNANYPITQISWYGAIYFCNALSMISGKTPVYSVNGITDVLKWKTTNKGSIKGTITQDLSADGYRLPTVSEWKYAAKGGQKFKYSGSDILNEVAWYADNSQGTVHPVAQKKPNGYGLYDMSGNVNEWCWDSEKDEHYILGGAYIFPDHLCEIDKRMYGRGNDKSFGFRIVCLSNK